MDADMGHMLEHLVLSGVGFVIGYVAGAWRRMKRWTRD